jgi:hypothetical protein
MSLCGYQATVKGIMANLLEDYGISADINGVEHYLTRSSLGYKVEVKKLPSGLVHGVLIPKLALPKNDEKSQDRFFIFTRDEKEIPALFFRHLDEKTDIPLHPSWNRWLWNGFEKQEGWLVKLRTLAGSYRGYSVGFHPKKLHDLISEAMKSRVPEITACMERKGGNIDGTIDCAQRIPG